MAIRKFVAPTTREAMMQVRRELGDDAVIIANRRAGNKIEILAAAPDAVDALVERSEIRAAAPMRERAIEERQERASTRETRTREEPFQDFVRRQMQADDVPPQPRSARAQPARGTPAQAERQIAHKSGVAMYHDVAEIEQEEFEQEEAPRKVVAPMAAPRRAVSEVQARESAREPVRLEAGVRRAPAQQAQTTTLQQSHRAHQVENAQPADPAVFRRRPAHVAPVVPVAPAPSAQAAPRPAPVAPPIDIVLEPPQVSIQAPVPAEPVVAPVVAAPEPVIERTFAPVVPVAAGHASVPSLPVRSQAAPIATAARLREASINAAAEMAAAMQPARVLAPSVTAAISQGVAPMPAPITQPAAPVAPVTAAAPRPAATWTWDAPQTLEPVVTNIARHAPVRAQMAAQPAMPVVPAVPAVPMAPAQPRVETQLLAELQSMRDMLREQIATLATKPAPEPAAPTTAAMRVMARLLTAGFSAEVARRIAAHLPQNADVAQAETWLHEVLAHNIRCADVNDGIVERAGQPATPGQVFALVGPTGVGKTTTVAKLAARFAVRHGTSALGLITLDAYRVAAPEQLRTYGRILGTPVHLAQDTATLRELLATMVHKRLVLIDTCGVSQRDERLGEMLDLLGAASVGNRPIQRVLLLNSASHAETLDEAARAWRAHECAGAILTKLDEATRIGGSLDVSLRHRLTLLGLTNGQRVPEDWHTATSKVLAHLALKPAAQLFELGDEEGAALMQARAVDTSAHGALHG
jgi:flagellar biosynthesis protein FlhF